MLERQNAPDMLDDLLVARRRNRRMVYGELALTFNPGGDLLIEQLGGDAPSNRVSIPDDQIDVIVAFINKHRLASWEIEIGESEEHATARSRTGILGCQ